MFRVQNLNNIPCEVAVITSTNDFLPNGVEVASNATELQLPPLSVQFVEIRFMSRVRGSYTVGVRFQAGSVTKDISLKFTSVDVLTHLPTEVTFTPAIVRAFSVLTWVPAVIRSSSDVDVELAFDVSSVLNSVTLVHGSAALDGTSRVALKSTQTVSLQFIL